MSGGGARGFVLAPAKFGSQGASQDEDKQGGGTRPNFTGLKQSKLGLLAESKLAPSGGLAQANTQGATETSASKTSFSFAPLSKPVSDENKPPSGDEKGVENTEKVEKKIVFGEKLSEKALAPVPEPKKSDDESGKKSGGMVFGQNLADRVVNAKDGEEESEVTPEAAEKKEKTEFKPSVTSNLFSSVSQTADDGEKKSLSESAKEYTDNHESNKRKYEEVEVVTGEEEESNVLQATGKLYLFDTEKRNWTERGRGQFRLNDDPVSVPGHLKSRLVMRTVGSLRVILNTKLWADMICEKADEKKVRISAFDEGEVKIFLVSTSPKDADKLFTALEYRISQLKTDKEEDSDGPPPEKKAAPSDV